jgi:hypothetical protein
VEPMGFEPTAFPVSLRPGRAHDSFNHASIFVILKGVLAQYRFASGRIGFRIREFPGPPISRETGVARVVISKTSI